MASDRPSSEVCAVFLLPDSAEIRRLKCPPRRGQRVRSMRGDLWFVTEVLQSGRNTYTVVCAASDVFAEDVLHRRSRDLASDLLWVVRKKIGSQEGTTLETLHAHPRSFMRTSWIEKYLFFGPQYGAQLAAHRNRPESDESHWLEAYLQRSRKRQHEAASARRGTRLQHAFSMIEHRLRLARPA
jgi:hypothetical protein